MAETTVTMQETVKSRLDGAALATARSRSWLIAAAMKHLVKRHGFMARDSGCVQYQEYADADSWRRVHVSFQGRDYDLFVDMRKFRRMSVSLMVSIAIGSFLDSIVSRILSGEYDEDTDNYPLQSYAIVQELIGSVICWKIFWGIPENPAQLLTPTA